MIRAVVVAVLALAVVLPARAEDMSLQSMRLYESDANLTPKDQRRYVSLLPRSSTRFVYWEMTVKNHLYNVREHSHSVVARWYNAQGVRFGETRQTFRVKKEWSSAWIAHGQGYSQAGRWQPGKYRIDILVDGKVYVRRHFLVYDDSRIDAENQPFTFTGLRLFEAGATAPPASQRQYKTRFDAASTRYIYAEIAGTNGLYGQRNQYPIIVVRFYRDDDIYAGEIILNRAIVRTQWRSALLTSGWGSRTPNTWAPGRYRAEVWMGNTNKVGETRFTVTTGDRPPSGPDAPGRREPDSPGPDPDKTDPDPGDKPPAPPKTAPNPSRDLQELDKL